MQASAAGSCQSRLHLHASLCCRAVVPPTAQHSPCALNSSFYFDSCSQVGLKLNKFCQRRLNFTHEEPAYRHLYIVMLSSHLPLWSGSFLIGYWVYPQQIFLALRWKPLCSQCSILEFRLMHSFYHMFSMRRQYVALLDQEPKL